MYEDRQCLASNLVPTVTNIPLPIDAVADARADGRRGPRDRPVPPVTLPPIPQVPLTPEQAEALIPDELLQRIQEFAFGGPTAAPCPRRRAASRARSSSAASARSTRSERARRKELRLVSAGAGAGRRGAPDGCCWWWACWSLVGAGLSLRLSPSAATGTLVGSGSDSGRATTVAHERFGDDAVYVLVRGDLPRLVLTSD